ncbi:MAG: hypothetical protein ISS19_01345 [Bacteroidales bacterium]|nr:hypothetical protein [Bacteroidales bacterium]
MKISVTLSVLLYLIALHSFIVGFVLVIIPIDTLSFFGYYHYQEPFFKVQGGVFHLVMALVYFLAAWDLSRNRILIYLTIISKFIATAFLFSYYLFIDRIWMVAASGAGDLIMGILVLMLFLRLPESVD